MSLLHWVAIWAASGFFEPTEGLIVGYVTGSVTAKAIGGTAEWRDAVGGSAVEELE